MKYAQRVVVSLCIVNALYLTVGCGSNILGPLRASYRSEEIPLFILNDRRDQYYECVYLIRPPSVVACRRRFPGLHEERYYYVAALPDSLLDTAKRLLEKPGVKSPSFGRGDVWFTRTTFPNNRGLEQQTVYYSNDDTDFRFLMPALRDHVCQDRNQVLELPSWSVEDPRVKHWLLPLEGREH